MQKARETKAAKAREAKHGQGAVESAKTIKSDLPVMSIADKEAVRKACFDKAWAQRRAREEASSSGKPFVPLWQQHKKQAAEAAAAAAAAEAKKEAAAKKAALAVTAALNRAAQSSDSDSD